MIKRKSIGIPLIIWGSVCLLPIPLAAIFPVNVCSYIYMVLWVICAIVFARLFNVMYQSSATNKIWVQTGASLMIVYYLVKALDIALQVKLFGNLGFWNCMSITSLLIGWCGLINLFYSLKMGVAGIVYMLSGITMTIPTLLSSSSSLGITEWDRFTFLVPISSLLYLIGFIVAIFLCIRWIKNG